MGLFDIFKKKKTQESENQTYLEEMIVEESVVEEKNQEKSMKTNKVFEDEFMEIQSGLVSLCLEVTESKVDKIFIYCSNEKKSKMFNAFFEVNGEITTLNQLGVSNDLAFEFLKLGTEDLKKLDTICETYSMPVPTELKLYYDVSNGKFNGECQYTEICSAKTGKSAGEVFMEWINEIRGQ